VDLRYGDTEYFLQSGFQPDWQAKSVGVVLKAYILRELIGAGIRYYDFLSGGEDYKMRWGADLRKYSFVRSAPIWSSAGVLLRVISFCESVKERLRNAMPTSIWNRLRRVYRCLQPLGTTET